tara:strand:- start:11053 stop:13005 length:1953 start_codon:yes stop_codon:yes gene_type:complete
MWIDRLTQTQLKTLPAIIDAGRYQFSHSDSTERFNQHSDINAGDLLLSDGSERFQLLNDSGSYNKLVVDNPERINLFQNAILTLGETLIKQENSINPNADLKLLSPLLPAAVINAELDLLPVEKTLQTVLEKGHLHEIAHHPRLDVRYVEEITDVARAKRLAKGALVHLASHSECWQRQTLSGVVPKKVKARFSEDDYQIYENRVFARLIDKLHHHICSRIRTVEQLQQTLNDALGFEDNSDAIDYRVSQKICALWGQTFDAESTLEALEQLDSTLSALSEMLKGITSLRQAGLYLMIPRHVQVGAALHRTNILNHDAHYRHLAILWEQLNRLQQTSQLTPAQRFAQQQLLASHYSLYAGLVLRHALAGNTQIQPKPTQHSVGASDSADRLSDYKWAGQTLRLQQHGFNWKVNLLPLEHQDQSQVNEHTLLEFTPWFGFSELPELSTPLASNRIILWPSIDNISNEKADDQQLGWCALSPLDLYCVERIGWLIDKTLNQHLTRNYASPIEKIPTQAANVIRTIQTGSTSSTTVELTGATPQLRLFEALNQQDADNLRKALDDDNAIQQAHQLQQQMLAITALTHCPVCAKNAQLTHQPPSGFRIECQECGTGRYLKQAKEELEIKFREKDPNNLAGAGFAARGRWAMPDR